MSLNACDKIKKNSKNKQEEQKVERECYPNVTMYTNYKKIFMHTVSLPNGYNSNNITGYRESDRDRRTNWHLSDEGCGTLFYFFAVSIYDREYDGTKIILSGLESGYFQDLTGEDLIRLKDDFARKNMAPGDYPTNYVINVMDGPYSFASDIWQENVNLVYSKTKR